MHVSYGLQDLELHVGDRGPAGAPGRVGGGGHGLVGMRERVRIFGGELHTGRAPAAASRYAPAFHSTAARSMHERG